MSIFRRAIIPAFHVSASSRARAAFTLVELLTVIAIIGVLAAIIIPVVGSVRTSAKRSLCVSNLRQVGVAILAFAGDNQGRLPRSSHGYGQEPNSWINTLRPYLGENDEVRACPLDPRRDVIIREKLSSFTLNEWLLPPSSMFAPANSRFTRLNQIPRPNQTYLAFLNREEKTEPDISDDHTHGTTWTTWSAVIGDIDPDRFRSGSPRDPARRGASPYLHADAHVAVITADRLAAQLAEAVSAGRALSQPH
jgi:prepilin-type N-terminal cleavage/methylation domain-containing protein